MKTTLSAFSILILVACTVNSARGDDSKKAVMDLPKTEAQATGQIDYHFQINDGGPHDGLKGFSDMFAAIEAAKKQGPTMMGIPADEFRKRGEEEYRDMTKNPRELKAAVERAWQSFVNSRNEKASQPASFVPATPMGETIHVGDGSQ